MPPTPRIRRLGALAAVAIAAATLLPDLPAHALGFGNHGRPDHHHPRPPALIEAPVCSGDESLPPGQALASGQQTQTITVRVRPTAQLRIDRHRRVLAASTNTGCAPRPGNDVYYVWPNGTLTVAPDGVLRHREWRGDFTQPGVFVSQCRWTLRGWWRLAQRCG